VLTGALAGSLLSLLVPTSSLHAQAFGTDPQGGDAPSAAAALRQGGAPALPGSAAQARPLSFDEVNASASRGASAGPPAPIRTVRPGAGRPFGANLFGGGFSNDREDGLNPNYTLQPGDRVSVRIWGAQNISQSLIVDPQGNVFIPSVGPVPLRGVRNADLNAHVSRAISRVYTDNVQVYTSLNGSQPVAVFVTGYVPQPGRFAGIPSNSPLHFIDRAGGIDALRGSYRDIRVMRDGVELVRVDLYRFLLDGELPGVQFRDGDTIVVGARGAVVSVSGDVANAALFELDGESIAANELSEMALLTADVSHAGVSGLREQGPFSIYVPLDQLDAIRLQDGDEIAFRIDRHDRVIVVEVEGSHLGPSRFAVGRDTRLRELLDHIAVDPALADTQAISLRRPTIAVRQKAALQASLRRLEARYLTASSQTDSESAIRAQEAQLISAFVKNAGQVEPDGRLVVARKDGIANVLLQPGDTITIPERSESVLVGGEVLVAQAMLHQRSLRARDYVARSGGFSDQADTDRLVVVHANGEVSAGKNPAVRAGDEVIVLPRVPVKNLQLAATIVDIVYKIAVAASVAINL